jgi:hypothetical protein
VKWDIIRGRPYENRALEPTERAKPEPRIAESALSVTLGQRLAKRCGPMPNIKGDRPGQL